MEKKAKTIEVRTGDGKLILSLFLIEKEVDLTKKKEAAANTGQQIQVERPKGNDQGGAPANGDAMTEAQRRYLFRILADQGIEGENAYMHLKNLFGVSNINEATKQEASQAISRLLEEGQGGTGDGPPF